ncbi:NAD-dependent epimerase/dehydratase family protein [Siculibacillus lacustris]|uniref:NAD-dependent epimerase/dehydratase family protein n=1 Tax=Siculibacillus lacustris TaxID=1549641 RepID=A0A4Q9VUV9_9HYPH|nr:NAD-dependent epimerase/dehydratase family protein [Siculibacillus lacustris]TBW38953.1 NAD-dependent epimerase/dehydratase family protein [Siculibacillus lacustris]
MTTVLVTGAAGLLGRHVVRELLGHGHSVRGLDRRTAAEPIDWFVGDVTDPALVARATAGVEAVFHVAAVPNIWSGDGDTIMRVNVLGTFTVLAAAEAAGVGRVVFCSSDSVAGYTVREGRMLPPRFAPLDLSHPLLATDPYAVSKVLGEDLCRAFALRGLAVVALRTVFVAYPEMAGEIVARAKDPDAYRGPVVGGPSSAGGGPLHHHVDPRDVARAFRLALELDMAAGAFEAFYLSAQATLSPEPTVDRLRRLHGDRVEIRDPELYARRPFAPLYDLTHAERRLGFVAEHDQRRLLAGLPGFPSGE